MNNFHLVIHIKVFQVLSLLLVLMKIPFTTINSLYKEVLYFILGVKEEVKSCTSFG